jgi:hypothetical protein
MKYWVDLHARDYGGLGVVLAIYFWIAFSSGISVAAASLPRLSQNGAISATAPSCATSHSGQRRRQPHEAVADGLRPLLELPIELVLPAHGAPTGRAGLERVLSPR